MTAGMLETEELAKAYSGVRAVAGVSVQLKAGEITAIVGANGAGKTTFLDLISGTIPATGGTVHIDGKEVTSLTAWRRGRLGLFRGFQDATLFADFTVAETLRVSAYRTHRYDPVSGILRLPNARRRDREVEEAVQRTAADYGLEPWVDASLSSLSLGMVKIVQLAAVALATPKWILLDEPAAGLARAEVDQLGERLRSASAALPGAGFLIVEHDAQLVANSADRVIVMAGGRISEDLRRHQAGWDSLLHAPTAAPSGSAAPRQSSLSAARAVREFAESPPAVVPNAQTPTSTGDGGDVLRASDLVINYGRFQAVHGVDIQVRPGTLAVLVGTNGAGKSSMLNAMVGLRPPSSGRIAMDGRDITRQPAHERAQNGLVLVPSGRGLIGTLTVAENLELTHATATAAVGRPTIDPLELFPELKPKLRQRAGTMSGGEQQMLALARSIQLHPKYLLIDELSLGLNPVIVTRLVSALLNLRDAGVGLLVVEQNAPFALSYSDEAYVMNRGRLAFHGPSKDAAGRSDLFRPVFLDTATSE